MPYALAAEETRKSFCELCGKSGGRIDLHHIRPKGFSGKGPDIPVNLVSLCPVCHDKAQRYQIKSLVLVKIAAAREGLALTEACRQIGWPAPEEEGEPKEPAASFSLEDLIQAYISLGERENETRWVRGQILDLLLERGAKPGWIAAQVGVSAAQIRVMVRTYRAFPTEEKRIPELSWFHHRIAAHTDEPEKWLAYAADNGCSTRQLQAIVSGETKEGGGQGAENFKSN